MNQRSTLRYARVRLTWIAYQVGAVGGLEMVYTIQNDRDPRLARYPQRAGFYGLVVVDLQRPIYRGPEEDL